MHISFAVYTLHRVFVPLCVWYIYDVLMYAFVCVYDSDKEGSKALQLTYKDKLRMVALTKQVAHGKYRPDVSPDVGFLDVVGNDRR